MGASEATLRLLLVGVDKGASKLFHDVGGGAETAGKQHTGFKVAAVAGLAAAGAAVVAFGKKSVNAYQDAAKESAMLSRVTGMTIQQSSRLRFAAEESGVEFGSLQKSMQRFAKSQATATGQFREYEIKVKEAAAAGKEFHGHLGSQATAFARLGVSIKDAQGHALPMNQVMAEVAEQFKKMPDGPNKTAQAMAMFGKSGADMIKILNKGKDGLKELGMESDKTGNTLSNIDGYKKTLQAQRDFHAATQGLEVQLGAALYPMLTKVTGYMAGHVGPIFTTVSTFVHQHQEIISKVAPVLAILVGAFASLVGILKVAKTVMAGVNLVMEANPIGLVVLALAALAIGLVIAYKHSETFRDIVNAAFHVVGDAIGFVKDHWKLLIELILGPFGVAMVFVVTHFDAIKNAARVAIKFVVDTFLGMVGIIIDGAAHAFGWVPGLGGKLKNAADAFDSFRDRVNSALDGIHSQKDIHLNVTTHQSVAVSSINKPRVGAGGAGHSATGARYLSGGAQWVGERGPEIAWFPRGTAISTAADSAAMTSGGSGGDLGTLTVVVKSDTGEVIEQKLVKLKRGPRGGARLAFV